MKSKIFNVLLYILCGMLFFVLAKTCFKARLFLYQTNHYDCIVSIEKRIKEDVIKRYVSSLYKKKLLDSIPPEWQSFVDDNGYNLSDRILFYIKGDPEEMYLYNYNGCIENVFVKHVFKTNRGEKIATIIDNKILSEQDIERITERFNQHILKPVEKFALDEKIPVDFIYVSPQ